MSRIVSASHLYAGFEDELELDSWHTRFDQMLLAEAREPGDVPGPDKPIVVGPVPAAVRGYQRRRGVLAGDGTLKPGRTVVLTGLGGTGKTQFAVGCIKQARTDRRVDLVVWVEAGVRENVIARFAEAAEAVGISHGRGPAIEANEFLAWLEGTTWRWLIVLDDVPGPASLRSLWPRGRGITVVTTRHLSSAFAADDRDVVPVGAFTPTESVQYLNGVLGREDPDAEPLSAELGHLPLALAQAANFINDHHLDCSGYLARLRTRPLEEVLPEPGGLPDDQIALVSATWTISVEAADELPPAGLARPLLEIAAMLDANGIPIAAFTAPSCLALLSTRLGRPVSADDAFDGLSCLERHSLGELDEEHRTFRVHQLVQRAVRESLTADEYRRLVRYAADALADAWPRVERQATYAVLLRGNAAALYRVGHDALWDGGLHQIIFRAGNSLGEEVLIEAAVEYWEDLLPVALERLGAEHRDTLTIRNNRAWSYGRAGDGPKALNELRDLLEVRRRVLGPLAVNTLATEHGVARWLISEGELAEAVVILSRLITDYENVAELGPAHDDTLNARHLLADTLGRIGPTSAAVAELRPLLDQCRSALGNDALVTLDVAVDLAWWLAASGSAAEAATLIDEALAGHLRVYGAAHADTFLVRHLAADVHGEAGDPERAVAELRELLADVSRVLGPKWPEAEDIRRSLDNWSAAA